MGVWSTIVVQYNLLSTFAVDAGVSVYNAVTPQLPKGSVIPPGRPGHGGQWPEFQPAKEGDSRSPCPALNAMANHGILPHDGKNIPFTEMTRKIHETYNFANTFCFFVPYYFANMLGRDYHSGTLDLADLALHNGIEHDASLCRADTAHDADQSKIHTALIERLLASASGPPATTESQAAATAGAGSGAKAEKTLTSKDVAYHLGLRRAESRTHNPDFSLALIHKGFGSANAATMLAIFGGDVKVLRAMLLEERILPGWEPHHRSRLGLSMAAFNPIVLGIHTKIDEKKSWAESKKAI